MAKTTEALHRAYKSFWQLGVGKILPGEEVLDLNQMAIVQSLTFLHKMKLGQTALSFDKYFQIKNGTRTRSEIGGELVIERTAHNYRENFFTVDMAKRYNKLPEEITQEMKIGTFKSKIKAHVKITDKTPWTNFVPWFMRRKRIQ